MLNRSQTKQLLRASFFDPSSQFYGIPKEIIRRIKYSPTPNHDFLAALKEVAYAQLEPLRTRLETAKNNKANPAALPALLLSAGDITTPAGILVQGATLLECAIGAGDSEMVEMIKPYFSLFAGDVARDDQLESYRDCIKELETQKLDDLTWLIEVFLASELEDVREELKTGKYYKWDHESPLRTALNEFRAKKLSKNRIITKSIMHSNDQNLIHAYEILDTYWNQLIKNGSYDKHKLFARQIIGFIQLTESTGLIRQLFAQGEVEAAAEGKATSRSFQYRHDNGSFPDFDQTSIDTHTAVGFDFYVSIYGGEGAVAGVWGGAAARAGLQNLYRTKTSNLQSLCSALKRQEPRV